MSVHTKFVIRFYVNGVWDGNMGGFSTRASAEFFLYACPHGGRRSGTERILSIDEFDNEPDVIASRRRNEAEDEVLL